MLFFKREAPSEPINNSDLEKLYQCLIKCDFKAPIKLDLFESSPLYPAIEVINNVIRERKASDSALLTNLDGAVQHLTSMTSIREMLLKIGGQTNQLMSMSAQAEELGAAANQVANSANNSSAFVEKAASAASSGGEKIRQAIQFVEHSFDEFSKVSIQVQEVLHSMQEIEKIVGVIAGVANQTNLLALNAAIEAARAGEQGRGFAVVADEVRQLAEHTKSSVTDIHQKISELSRNSQETSQNISVLSRTMQSGKNIMEEAAESLQVIIHDFASITEDIHTIAASSEEQSAAVQETAGSVAMVATAAEEVEKIARVTGQGIYDISQTLQRIRADQIGRLPELDRNQALELYKTDHLLWTWRIYNMILGFEHLQSSEVGDHHDCRLGRWVDSEDASKCRSLSVFGQLEFPHRQVHELAREAVVAYERGNTAEAERILARMGQASEEVIKLLSELQKQCQ